MDFSGTRKYSILMASDFSTPGFGGVETHSYNVCQCLINRGHKVIFISNLYKNERSGVRTFANGLKYYHIPVKPLLGNGVASFMVWWHLYPVVREILIKEQVDIVHSHMTTSLLGSCCINVAKLMGLKTVITEHSLFNFGDMAGINLNKMLKWGSRDLDAAIAVSQACKDNFYLRAKMDPEQIFIIPNATDTSKFSPDLSIRNTLPADIINIVFISRLEYRKGVDLLIAILPRIISKFKNVNFIIGGDGIKMAALRFLIDKYNLHSRVELLGGLKHHQVNGVLNRGHIFLNCSLTESFCIAILEAACCNLLVVSTDVGGVPEVLPSKMIYLSKPNGKDLY
jgi:phosphatidylinositol glycan class A protein